MDKKCLTASPAFSASLAVDKCRTVSMPRCRNTAHWSGVNRIFTVTVASTPKHVTQQEVAPLHNSWDLLVCRAALQYDVDVQRSMPE